MADSRRASFRKMKRMELLVYQQSRIIYFLLSFVMALLLTFFIKDESFNMAQEYVLFLLFFSIGLWLSEAIPPFAVGIMIVGFLVFFLGNTEMALNEGTDIINVKKFVNTWSNSVIWLLLGGFFLANGMKKTGLDEDLFRLSIKGIGNKASMVLLGLMLATGFASMIMSNTATTALMLASVMPLIQIKTTGGNLGKALLLGIPIAASLGGMGTIIGSPPNAIAVDSINRMRNATATIDFLDWMLYGVPIALLMIVICWYALVRYYKVKDVSIDLASVLPKQQEQTEDEIIFEKELRRRKRIAVGILMITVLLWITGRVHGIPAAGISGIPIIAFTMLSIVTGDDVRTLPWDTLMLVAGGLSLGLAIQETHLDLYFLDQLKNIHVAPIILVLIFAFCTVLFSNIMSNTATATILIPVAVLWEIVDPLFLPLVIGLSASCALLLPISTPPNAIAYATGLLDQKEFRLGGFVAGLVGPIIVIAWVFLLLKIF